MQLDKIMDRLPDHKYIKVSCGMSIPQLTELVRDQPGIRSIYVEDENGRIVGEVSLGSLIKIVTARRQRYPRLSARTLLSRITSSKVQDIMDRNLIFAMPEEDVEIVIMRSISHNIKEIPVLDLDGKILKNIGVLDLWAVAAEENIQ